MSYQKAIDILPLEVIQEIQKYMDGGIIYIPKKENQRRPWGSQTQTKKQLAERNSQIYQEFLNGASHRQLAEKYFLDIKSIQRIIRNFNSTCAKQ